MKWETGDFRKSRLGDFSAPGYTKLVVTPRWYTIFGFRPMVYFFRPPAVGIPFSASGSPSEGPFQTGLFLKASFSRPLPEGFFRQASSRRPPSSRPLLRRPLSASLFRRHLSEDLRNRRRPDYARPPDLRLLGFSRHVSLTTAFLSDPCARNDEHTRAIGTRGPSTEDGAHLLSFTECAVCLDFWKRPCLLRPCLLLEASPRFPDSRFLLCCASSDSGASEPLLN